MQPHILQILNFSLYPYPYRWMKMNPKTVPVKLECLSSAGDSFTRKSGSSGSTRNNVSKYIYQFFVQNIVCKTKACLTQEKYRRKILFQFFIIFAYRKFELNVKKSRHDVCLWWNKGKINFVNWSMKRRLIKKLVSVPHAGKIP